MTWHKVYDGSVKPGEQVYTEFQCCRCGHHWPSKQKSPTICPLCKSPYWNKPKTKKETAHNVSHPAPGRAKEGH